MHTTPGSSRHLCLLLGLLLWLLPAPARARDGADFRRRYDQAMRLYQSGRYAESIDEFQAAYAVQQFPRILYNLGRAHLQLGHAAQALDLLQKYLELEPDPPPEIRAKVRLHIEKAQAMLDAGQRLSQPAAPDASASIIDSSRSPDGRSPAAAPAPGRPGRPLPGPAPLLSHPTKAGPFVLNLRLGPAVPLALFSSDTGLVGATELPTEFALGLEAGFALNQGRSLYLVVPAQVQLELTAGKVTATWLMAPLGLHGDLPIRAAPGLFLYLRLSVGYAVGLFADAPTTHMGLAVPALGIKYVIRRRVNLGFEPLNLPMLFHPKLLLLFYRPMFHLGVNL